MITWRISMNQQQWTLQFSRRKTAEWLNGQVPFELTHCGPSIAMIDDGERPLRCCNSPTPMATHHFHFRYTIIMHAQERPFFSRRGSDGGTLTSRWPRSICIPVERKKEVVQAEVSPCRAVVSIAKFPFGGFLRFLNARTIESGFPEAIKKYVGRLEN